MQFFRGNILFLLHGLEYTSDLNVGVYIKKIMYGPHMIGVFYFRPFLKKKIGASIMFFTVQNICFDII